ncbi:MAG: peptide-methionine (S)-S-oxide reductase MsrA [Candidatus Bathyarchaeota archaeon]|nr:peptide-methionine (S)-S-oxide reductase MsrA [Candidatus Bathyarchaeota archaeon]
MSNREETITLGGGCFWCTEAVFVRLKGVTSAFPGYSGGHVTNPTYEQVSTGATGHAEVVQITYDPAVITFRQILEIFFATHDPTTLNQQGADIGTQYRSIVFYHTEDQRSEAEAYIRELTEKSTYKSPIVTRLEPFKAFYPAEEYHLKYYERNRNAAYSRYVITPKVEKLEKKFGDKLKG